MEKPAAAPAQCLSVLIPAFNDESTIQQQVQELLEQECVGQVMVVNDASTDGTPASLRLIADPRLMIINHRIHQGIGAALRSGLRFVNQPYVAVCKPDRPRDPSDLERLVQPLVAGSADVVYGTEELPDDGTRLVPRGNESRKKYLTTFVNVVTKSNFSDITAPCISFRKEVIDGLVVEEAGAGHMAELAVKITAQGWRVTDVALSAKARGISQRNHPRLHESLKILSSATRYAIREKTRSRRASKLENAGELGELLESLENLEDAENYYAWITELIAPYLDGDILEVGAGSGTVTDRLVRMGLQVTAVEPDVTAFSRLKERFNGVSQVRVVLGDSGTISETGNELFDGAVMVNVLEHVQHDRDELVRIASMLKPGKYIVLWVPANELLYSKFDLGVGHYRRYTRRSAAAVCLAAGLELKEVRYINAPGALAWALVAKMAGLAPTQGPLTSFYDARIVPVVKAIESKITVPFGQSILVVAQTR